MKKILYLFLFISISEIVFPQEKLHGGIYLINQSKSDGKITGFSAIRGGAVIALLNYQYEWK